MTAHQMLPAANLISVPEEEGKTKTLDYVQYHTDKTDWVKKVDI